MSRKPLDLSGRRFGRLTAVERLEEKKGTNYVWRCVCDCGREAKVEVRSLLSGNTTSCGCVKLENCRGRAKDITGMQFGKLTALRPLGERRAGSVLWLCACDCGKQSEYSYNELVHLGIKSCGCAQHPSRKLPMHYVEGTCVEKLQSQKLRKDNTSGHTGVIRTKTGWRAQISFKRKTYHLGVFDKYEDAVQARVSAEQEVFGAFLEWYNEKYRTEQVRTIRKARDRKAHTAATVSSNASPYR